MNISRTVVSNSSVKTNKMKENTKAYPFFFLQPWSNIYICISLQIPQAQAQMRACAKESSVLTIFSPVPKQSLEQSLPSTAQQKPNQIPFRSALVYHICDTDSY